MNSLILANPLFGLASDGRGFYVFGLEIYYYALCIVSGMICAAVLSAFLMKRRNMSSDFIFLLFITCIPTALITARLFSCLTDSALGIQRFFDFRGGGLSIIGGVIGGVAMGLLICVLKKVNFLRAADCVVPTILFAMALGRWGNFFNGEVYGGVAPDYLWGKFPFAVPIDGTSGVGAFSNPNATWHYAFFFYESLLDLAGGAALYAAAWHIKKKPNGLFACSYFLYYGIIRSIMEPYREEQYQLGSSSFIMAILFVVLSAAGIAALLIINYKKEGAVFGSKRGDPCGITKYLTPYKDDPPYYSKINMFGDQYPPRPPKEQGKSSVAAWFKKHFTGGGKSEKEEESSLAELLKKQSEKNTAGGSETETAQTKQSEETKQAEAEQTQEKKDDGAEK